jgi:fermentation-respiration switch protein FrsA (DUF1100 family)
MALPPLSLRLRFLIFLLAAAAALAAGMVLCKSPSETVHLAAVPGFVAYVLLFRPDIPGRIRPRHLAYFAALAAAVAAYLAAFPRVATLLRPRWSELPLAMYFLAAVHIVVWLTDRLINMTLSALFRLRRDARRPLRLYLPKTALRAGLFVVVVTPYLSATFLTHWVKFADGTDPRRYMGAAYERVAMDAPDGLRLEGWFIPSSEGTADATVIVVPGRGLSKACFLPYARMLHHNDYNVLLMDLRGEGGSEGHTRSFGTLESQDVLAAARYLRRCRPAASRWVFGYGISGGAAAVIAAAGSDGGIQAVVADSAFAHVESALDGLLPLPAVLAAPLRRATLALASVGLGCNLFEAGPIRDIARISPRPVLLIHGKADSTFALREAEDLYAAAGAPAMLLRIGQAEHGQAMLVGGSEYTAQVLGLFKAVRQNRPVFVQ